MHLKQLFFTLSLIFIFTYSNAQNLSVRGIVVDQQTLKPLEYAIIALLQSDSTLVSGTVSKSNGSFEFTKLNEEKYLLKIVFIGYQNKFVALDFSQQKQLTLGNIALSASSALLNQVVITGEKLVTLNKIDKQSYRADQFESAKGGNAIDVLKNLPSVSVNGEGDISVRGSSGFLVLINGKPVLTDAQTILGQLPANSIENIELITSPSAKYDPDGKGGIINIITKKGANDGFTVTANALAGLPSTITYDNKKNSQRYGADLALNYRKGKLDLAFGANYTRNDNAGYREGDVYTKNFTNNTITRFPSAGERSFDKKNYATRISAVFTADKNNVFSTGFYIGKRYQDRLADINYTNSTSNLSTGAVLKRTNYYNSNLQNKQGNFALGNLDYTHTFANKSALTASVLYEKAKLYGSSTNVNLRAGGTSDTIQRVLNPYSNPINGYRLKLDYTINIGKGKLETGYQFRSDEQNGQFDYFVSPPTSQLDAARFRGKVEAKNQINSIYSQFTGKFDQLDYIGGLRYEYASRSLNLSYDPIPHQLKLSNLFPSLSLLYRINTGLQLKAGYSRRIQRTNNFELNPIPEREHSETLEQGDPDLLPSFIDLIEFGLIRNFSKGSFFTTAYYQNIKNPIQRVNSVYADTILNRVFTNAEKARTFGFELGSTLQPTKWLNFYLGTNVYNYKINGNLTILGASSTVNNSNWVYSINANTNFKLNSSWSVQGNVNYLSKRPTAQGEDSQFLVPNSSLKKTFMKGLFSATLQWQNMDLGFMGSQRQRITTMGKDFFTTTNYIYETDVFLLNFSFNLNKLTSKSKLPNSEFGDKEF